MNKQKFHVTATQDRWVKLATGETVLADEGYVTHFSVQTADSEKDAIEQVLAYHVTPGTKYDHIRAELA